MPLTPLYVLDFQLSIQCLETYFSFHCADMLHVFSNLSRNLNFIEHMQMVAGWKLWVCFYIKALWLVFICVLIHVISTGAKGQDQSLLILVFTCLKSLTLLWLLSVDLFLLLLSYLQVSLLDVCSVL